MLRMDGIFYTQEVRVKGKAVRKNTPLNRAFPDKLYHALTTSWVIYSRTPYIHSFFIQWLNFAEFEIAYIPSSANLFYSSHSFLR